MKKFMSIFVAIIMILSVSSFAFADTPDEIPAVIYQKCIDDTPEGSVLVDVTLTEDGELTFVNASYKSLAQPRGTVTHSDTVSVWHNNSVILLQYKLTGTFVWDGSSAYVATSTFTKTYHRNAGDGYVVNTSSTFTQDSNGNPAVTRGYGYFTATLNGTPIYPGSPASTAVYCDAYGNVW